MNIVKAIQSHNQRERNAALKSLYCDPIINNKVRQWANYYQLKGKEPDDILQEAIILLDRNVRAANFEQKSKLETYLLAICKNLMRGNAKKKNRMVWKETITDDIIHQSETFEDHLELREMTEQEKQRDNILNKLINQMKPVCKESLSLYYFKGKTTAQVAEERQLKNADQAKKALYRCRNKLRIVIQNHPILRKILNL